jgi:quercetin dioxygenase-like cupin family protein
VADENQYFAFDPETVSDEPGRFVDVNADIDPIAFTKGLTFQPVLGDRVMVNVVRFEPHSEAPVHIHDEEQVTIVVEGEMEFEIAGETRTMRPGQMAVIPPNVPHGARTKDSSCVEMDVFVPPRRALLDMLGEQAGSET